MKIIIQPHCGDSICDTAALAVLVANTTNDMVVIDFFADFQYPVASRTKPSRIVDSYNNFVDNRDVKKETL